MLDLTSISDSCLWLLLLQYKTAGRLNNLLKMQPGMLLGFGTALLAFWLALLLFHFLCWQTAQLIVHASSFKAVTQMKCTQLYGMYKSPDVPGPSVISPGPKLWFPLFLSLIFPFFRGFLGKWSKQSTKILHWIDGQLNICKTPYRDPPSDNFFLLEPAPNPSTSTWPSHATSPRLHGSEGQDGSMCSASLPLVHHVKHLCPS